MNSRIRAVVAAFALAGAVGAQATAVPGQGTWESTLLPRDLDSNLGNGYEAYYDTALNITWLANANKNGEMSWADANTWASDLTDGGFTDWRLPATLPVSGTTLSDPFGAGGNNNGTTNVGYGGTASEMGHLYYVTLGNLGRCTPNNALPFACDLPPVFGLTNTGPFSGLQSRRYWSGTVYAPPSPLPAAWLFNTLDGHQLFDSQGVESLAMAVRPGDVAAMVPEPQTYALMLSGLAAMWVPRRRRAR